MLELFNYGLLHTPRGRNAADRVVALLQANPLLRATSEPWSKPVDPTPADLYSCLLIVTDDIGDDGDIASRFTRHLRAGLNVIPVVETLGSYDFGRPPLAGLASFNALGLDNPERLTDHLLHHAGLASVATGGQVFISYGRRDGGELAAAIDRNLRQAGFRSFIDIREIAGGAAVQPAICSEIRKSNLVVYVDSHYAARSRWVSDELDVARASHVPVVAVTLEGGYQHAFPVPSIVWTDGLDVDALAARTVACARRILARQLAFEDRAVRVLTQLSKLRGWSLARQHSPWTVSTPEPIRVACQPDEPTPEKIDDLARSAEPNRGLLVAGTRPYSPAAARAWTTLGAQRVRVSPLSRVASQASDGVKAEPLAGLRIFLSAAAPDPCDTNHAEHTLGPFVVVFVQTVIGLGATLVFGGHPSVTPLVHQAVLDAGVERTKTVELHQARYWLERSELVHEALDVNVFAELQCHGEGRDAASDIRYLRDGMIRDLDAAVFVGGKVTTAIGGKPGILDEYETFRKSCAGKPAFILGLAKGASAWLASEPSGSSDPRDPRLRQILAETTDPDLATALIVAGLLEL